MTEERYTTGLESGEWCFFAVPYPGRVFFSKNQVKDASEDRMSNSEISERVSLIFIACLPGDISKGSGLWFFELSRVSDLKNLLRFLKMP